ncbi:hypothetical protein ACIQYG_13705 [Peribacillus sp. NPDC096622]|uniref:hypothetical protein n=1 Tax=Peribacillus sp. NPDC096622 TaxID=3364396 RepID=UPI0037F4AAED
MIQVKKIGFWGFQEVPYFLGKWLQKLLISLLFLSINVYFHDFFDSVNIISLTVSSFNNGELLKKSFNVTIGVDKFKPISS